MTTNEPSTSVPDYSEAFIRIQHLHRGLQKQVQAKDYVAARNNARLIALEAMLIGIWCKQFIGEEK
jgi:hypothetical protein